MFHELSQRYRREFSRSIEAVRFGMAAEFESLLSTMPVTPVLLIKAVTLKLKYLIRLRNFRLLFWKLDPSGHLWYGVQIDDDPVHPGILWSIGESGEETTAVSELLKTGFLCVFLFNEDGTNVASARVSIYFTEPDRTTLIADPTVAPEGAWRQYENVVDSLLTPSSSVKLLAASPAKACEWIEVHSTLISRRSTRCEFSLISGEEGNQQELLAEWLVDALGAPVAARNPLVHEQRRPRELSDLLLSYEYGSFLLESKTLAVLDREQIPERATLAKNVLKQLSKAVNQLAGACANIRRGLRITDRTGQDLELTRDQPIHCMILVPDLNVIAECDALLVPRLSLSLMQRAKGFLHLLDPSELRRLVHNAGFMAANSRMLTPIMAFDGILMKRSELAWKQRSPDFRFSMILRHPEE
jgi:hypothetical protein